MAEQTIPEPPDGARIEWEYRTDLYAAWRDDASSAEAGWTPGDGGEVWCVYPGSVPRTWRRMLAEFGESLGGAHRLYAQGDVDRAVAEAFAAAGITILGDHLGEASGWCRRCGVTHSPTEWARIRAQLDEGGS